MAERTFDKTIWTPSNIITLVRIMLVPVFVAALLAPWPEWFGMDGFLDETWKRVIAAAIFILISATDWLDGYLARSQGRVTDFGKLIDPLADKILVAAALISLVELEALPTWVVLIILSREFIVSGVRMMAASKGVVIAASMLGKFKTVFQMIAIVLFVLKGSHTSGTIGDATGDWLWDISWIFMIIALALTLISMGDYLIKARELFGFTNGSVDELLEDPTLDTPETALLLSLAETLINEAKDASITLATAESLTGGMIGELLTSVPGSSEVYKGGIVSYTNEVKQGQLGVDEALLRTHGAVSEQVALAMAEGVRRSLKTDRAVSVTGIAGPGGAEEGKPVGTVWIALSSPSDASAHRYQFIGDRASIRMQTAAQAMELLLRSI